MQTLVRRLAVVGGCLAALPLSLLVSWTIHTPITGSGALYLLGALVTTLGALTAPWRRHRNRGLLRLGLVLLGGTATGRLLLLSYSTTVRLTTFPHHHTRWVNRLVDEQDVALFGARVLSSTDTFLTPREAVDVMPALHAAYAAMRATDGTTASPFLSTYLGLQQPGLFDVVEVDPDSPTSTRSAVVFLHGFTGNFTIQCWLVAQAAREVGAVTACPSVGWRGDWWSPHGQTTVQRMIEDLRQRGIERIYLAGLSNGAVGASRLAPHLGLDLAGLILISGADPAAAPSGLPILILQGAQDERMPVALARQMAQQAGTQATYHELDSDHFVLAKRAAEARHALVTWLVQQETSAQ
ncbi:MAG: alpha/beta hydrolase [Chloroflexota bacterium]|nr:alpha/beta hydrolase [Chloroflexota bacterium]